MSQNEVLLAYVSRAKRWVDICCNMCGGEASSSNDRRSESNANMLVDTELSNDKKLRATFATYYLEALLVQEPAEKTFDRLIKDIATQVGFDPRRVSYILKQESLNILGSAEFHNDGDFRQERYALVAGPQIFYRDNESAAIEDVLRESLMKKCWDIHWANCPGYPIFALKSDRVTCHSIFEKVNYSVLTKQEIISTVLPQSKLVEDKIFEILEKLVKRKPTQKIILLSSFRPERTTNGKKYSQCSAAGYCHYINMTDAEVIAALRAQLPAIPSRRLNFDAMFQELAKPLPAGTNAYYRTFNHTREGVQVAIELELGLVNRSYPEEYVAADSISDFFSYEQRMECTKTKRTAKGRLAQPSPIQFWKSKVVSLTSVLEENGIQTEEDMAEYLYANTNACGIFNAGFAAHIYRRFGSKGCRILDAFAGWGERMAAGVAIGCSEYQGYDTNPRIPYAEIQRRLGEKSDAKLNVEIVPFELAEPKKNHFNITIGSPPFFDYELYMGGETSTTRYQRLEKWDNDFWRPSLVKILESMRSGGHIFLYIPTGGDDVAKTMNQSVQEVYADEAVYVGKIGYAQQVVNSPKMIRTAVCYRKK